MSKLAWSTISLSVFFVPIVMIGGTAEAQDAADNSPAQRAAAATSELPDSERETRLADYLSGATLSGRFTVDGRENVTPKAEEYTIAKCEKLAEKDMYRLTARIKYGDTDQEVPLDLRILWSGNTPVITLDAFWIPGMGTFSSRVMIHSGRYAGTWQHDDKGGHLFGSVEKGAGSEEKGAGSEELGAEK